MPFEICKFARDNRIKICKRDFETASTKGFRASQNRKNTTIKFNNKSIKFTEIKEDTKLQQI